MEFFTTDPLCINITNPYTVRHRDMVADSLMERSDKPPLQKGGLGDR